MIRHAKPRDLPQDGKTARCPGHLIKGKAVGGNFIFTGSPA
jgi:hypothetical protein